MKVLFALDASKTFEEGYRAATKYNDNKNPYEYGIYQYREWEKGWKDGADWNRRKSNVSKLTGRGGY